MKATLYMATYNKNDLLPNTLYSIARQKTLFPLEVCIVDDHSEVDPELIIRKFIPDAKYKRFESQQGFDVVTTHVLSLASNDSDIIIMQSADVMHYAEDTIERLCEGVEQGVVCMATVKNTNPPHDMYTEFSEQLPAIFEQWIGGGKRGVPGRDYFFLGAMLRSDYESLKCAHDPHCDVILKKEMKSLEYKFIYPSGLIGFHQQHNTATVPCKNLSNCKIKCKLKKRCIDLGWENYDDYLRDRNGTK